MIPVAAVARPRQGIRVPAGGAPARSAGSIAATAGDGQVTITRTAAPSGWTGPYTEQLYRSTAQGAPGMPIATDPAFPYVDTGLANGQAVHYTLRVSAGVSTAETGQVSATPQAAGSPSVLLFAKDFSDGAWAPINTPTRGNAADYAIVDDPTGSGRGKMARIHYHRDSTGDGELDKNRAFTLNHIPQLVGPTGMTYGSRCYVKTDVYVAKGTMSGFAPEFDQRKLMYPKFGDDQDGNLRHDWAVILDGRVANDPRGSGMDMRIISGTKASSGYAGFRDTAWEVASVAYDTWHTLEMEWRLNDAGADNAWLKVWFNGVLVLHRTQFRMVDPHVNGLPYDRLYDFEVGDQQQGNTDPNLVPNPSLFDSYRYFDNLVVRTAKP